MAVNTLFFDAAGTLIQLSRPVGEVYAQIAARHGLEADAGAMTAAFRAAWKALPAPQHPEGRPPPDDDRSWWRSLVARAFDQSLGRPLADAELDPLFAELYDHFALPEAWTVFDDVLPTLEAVQGRCRLFVLSNFDRRLRRILAGHGLDRCFEGMIISSEVGASKPHARIFETALRVASARPQDCLHIGDDPRADIADIAGAQALGIQTYLVNRPTQGLAGVLERVYAAP